MDSYQKLAYDVSDVAIDEAVRKRIQKERHQNRFNYYNCIIATLALIISIIATVLELCR